MGERLTAAFPGFPRPGRDAPEASGLGLGEVVAGAIGFEELGESHFGWSYAG